MVSEAATGGLHSPHRFAMLRKIVLGFFTSSAFVAVAADRQAPDHSGPPTFDPPPMVVVDQFGYTPSMRKIAVFRDPVGGYDAGQSFEPTNPCRVVRVDGGAAAYSGDCVSVGDGGAHPDSGDRAWWFDFSDVRVPGRYVVEDAGGTSSDPFTIGDDVYDDVLKVALKTFFYQRAGCPKQPPFADERWSDTASHLGPGQDPQARRHDAKTVASTERDLRGGWYDAGDYNKYTNWTANYVLDLVAMHRERPAVWTDDLGVPESGNGVPDVLDEAAWGAAWLLRMQDDDGGVLSILGLDSDSPPSKSDGPSFYGPASASASWTTAAALAAAAAEFRRHAPELTLDGTNAAEACLSAAVRADRWAEAHPDVKFQNNTPEYNSVGLGAGRQEVDDTARRTKRMKAKLYLWLATGEDVYRDALIAALPDEPLLQTGNLNTWRNEDYRDLLLAAERLGGSDPGLASKIRSTYLNGLERKPHVGAKDDPPPYRSLIPSYTWGSNAVKAREGLLFADASRALTPSARCDVAADYLHYLHGVNPMGLVYLTNMNEHGATRSANTLYHAWYCDGSPRWDDTRTGVGPLPGLLVGGPNPSYDWDGCCDSDAGCGGGKVPCGDAPPAPPKGQPPAKSYREFNDSWPLNSWSVTENSNGYQTQYLRLLSKFVSEGGSR